MQVIDQKTSIIMRVFILVGLAVFLLYSPSVLAQQVAGQQVALQRSGAPQKVAGKSQEALKLADKKKWAEAAALSAGLNDNIAKALLDWYLFRSDQDYMSFDSMAGFIKKYPDWPSVQAIRAKAEKKFPAKYPDQSVINWFAEYAPITYEGADRYGSVLLKHKKTSALKSMLAKWFPGADLDRDQQAAILKRYGHYLPKSVRHDRFHNLLIKGEGTLATALAPSLGKDYIALAKARLALRPKAKGSPNAHINKLSKTMQNDVGLILERARWRRRAGNLDGAVQILKTAGVTHHKATRKALWGERHILLRELILQKKFKTAYDLARRHQQQEGLAHAQAQWLAGWLALRHANKPRAAFNHFYAIHGAVKTPISKARAAYWVGRASEALKDQKAMKAWYGEAARYPTVYYGQLAADRMGLDLGRAFSSASAVGGESLKAMSAVQFAKNSKVRAAQLLYQAGLHDQSETFLWSLMRDASDDEVRFSDVSKLALSLGAPNVSVATAKRAERKGFILTRYAYPDYRARSAKASGFKDQALIHGLIRQESGFDTGAISRSGARGLMQLMPATAKETARKLGLQYSKGWLNSRPHYNMQLGSQYIAQMLDRFGGSYPMAIAAYNGGPGRVSGWANGALGDAKGLSHDALIDWIEMIPIYETRNYVQRVTEAKRIYDVLFQSGAASKRSLVRQ